jgi:hypothetical protein
MKLQTEADATSEFDASSYIKRQTLAAERPSAERHVPPELSLDEHGIIQDCSKSIEMLFGYRQCELLWQHISCLFPQLSGITLIQDGRVNPLLNYMCHCDHAFEALNKQSDFIICNLSFFRMQHEGIPTLRLIVRPVTDAKS